MSPADRTSDLFAALLALAAGSFALAVVAAVAGAVMRPALVADAPAGPVPAQAVLLLVEADGAHRLKPGDVVTIHTAAGTLSRRVIVVEASVPAGAPLAVATPEPWAVMHAAQADVGSFALSYREAIAESAPAVAAGLVLLMALGAAVALIWLRISRARPAAELGPTAEPAHAERHIRAAL